MRDLRKRLDELKAATSARAAGADGPTPRPRTRPAITALSDAVGGEELRAGSAACWCVETPFDAIIPDHRAPRSQDVGPLSVLVGSDERERATIEPRRTLVLDIETGGFSGTPVFLIGIVPLDLRPLRVIQFLARDYPEEEAILRAFAERATTRDAWITFNGRSFDEPFLRDRAAVHRVAMRPPRWHLDLLPAARRRWRNEVPNCRLATLESRILGRPRVGDIPSAEVPDLFHQFVRTRNAAPLKPVLVHNQIDLLSSVELLLRFAQPA